LCLHLRINPETKLATPLGTLSQFLVVFCIFCGHLLWFHFSLVLSVSESSRYPERPPGSISLCQFCFHFQNFHHLQNFSHYVQLQPARTGQVRTLHIGSSANTSHLALRWPARILSSRTVFHYLPASKIF
jgi:hypothetical protein